MECALYLILGVVLCSVVSAVDVEDLLRRLDRQDERVMRLTQEVYSVNKELVHQQRKHWSLAARVNRLEQTLSAAGTSVGHLDEVSVKLIQEQAREMIRTDLDNVRSSLAEEKKRCRQASTAVEFLKETSDNHSENLNVVRVDTDKRIAALGNKTEDLEKKCNACLIEETGHQLNNSIHEIKQTLAEVISKVANETEIRNVIEAGGKLNSSKGDTPGRVVPTTSRTLDEDATKDCPDNWVSHGGSCYYFQPTNVRLNHDSAVESCITQHAESVLVAIETEGEFNFLKTHLTINYSSIRHANGWMTSGKKHGGSWRWTTTGKAVNTSALSWGPGEPDGQECLTFWPSFEFKMAAVDCETYPRRFICEM